jgi:hypothetical protein
MVRLARLATAGGAAICPPCRRGPGDLPALARAPRAVTPEKTRSWASLPGVALSLLSRRLGRATSCTINCVRSQEAWP